MAVVFGALGVAQTVTICLKLDASRVVGEATAKLDGVFKETTLPAQVDAWQRASFECATRKMTSNLGTSSSIWMYQSDDATAVVRIDYPFVGWHHLLGCYEAQGWQVKSNEGATSAAQSIPDLEVWQLELTRPAGDALHVRCSQFDGNGRPVRPAAWQLTSWRRFLRHSPAKYLRHFGPDTSTYQVIMQVSTSSPKSDEWHQGLSTAFLSFREYLVGTVVSRLHSDG